MILLYCFVIDVNKVRRTLFVGAGAVIGIIVVAVLLLLLLIILLIVGLYLLRYGQLNYMYHIVYKGRSTRKHK